MSLSNSPSARPIRRVAVIGGGVIGLACARALRRRGADVSLYERGELGEGASVRAAGMLGTTFESAADASGETILALTLRSMELWPGFASELSAVYGPGIGYRRAGAICLALDAEESVLLRQFELRCRSLGLETQVWTSPDIGRYAPALTARDHPALVLPQDGSVDPPALLAALAAACLRDGVDLKCGRAIDRVRAVGGRFDVPGARFDAILLATGASDLIEFQDDAGRKAEPGLPPILPVKGQMLAVASEGLSLDTVVHGAGVYIVPQGDRILVGATVERGRRDLEVDPAAIEDLLAKAVRLVPGLASARRLDAWAGVRPGSPDDAPLIGETRIPGVFAALGHYRHGVRLAPATAEAIADLIVAGKTAPYLAPCDPLRFDNLAAASQSR